MRRPLNPEGRFPNPPRWRDPWRVEVVYVEREGRAVVADLRIYVESPRHGDEGEDSDRPEVASALREALPNEGLTSANLRSLNLSSLRRGDEQSLRELVLEHGLGDYLDLRPKRPRRRRPMQQGRALDDDFYAQVSIDYLDAVRERPEAPLVALLRKYPPADRTESEQRKVLRDRVALARRHGWLTSAGKKGRAGGKPGPRLIEWRKQRSKERAPSRKRTPKQKEA